MQFSAGGIQRRRDSAPEGCRHHLRARRDRPISHLITLIGVCISCIHLRAQTWLDRPGSTGIHASHAEGVRKRACAGDCRDWQAREQYTKIYWAWPVSNGRTKAEQSCDLHDWIMNQIRLARGYDCGQLDHSLAWS